MCSPRPLGPLRVKLRRTQCEQMSSGLPLKADIAQSSQHVSKVPEAEVVCHSITLSAHSDGLSFRKTSHFQWVDQCVEIFLAAVG